jgi:hypothetical protein
MFNHHPDDERQYAHLKRQFTPRKLHGAISLEVLMFMTCLFIIFTTTVDNDLPRDA